MYKTFFIALLFLSIRVAGQNDWRLSIQTWTFHKHSFLESVDKADSLGIRYLEVYPGQQIGGTIPGVFSYQLKKEERDKIKQYLLYKNVKVIAIGVVDKYYYTKDNLNEFFEFAGVFDWCVTDVVANVDQFVFKLRHLEFVLEVGE